MRKSIELLIGEMDAKLSGHAGMLNYRYMTLCIKAEPLALLSFFITDIEGNEYTIEQVADCMQPDQFSFEIVPHKMEMIPFIQKGIAEAHPEFKQDVIKPKEDNHFFMSDSEEYDAERHIVCTMPEVDDARYDTLKDAVKTLYDECKVEVDKVRVKYSEMLADRVKELPKDEAEEAKDKMEKLGNLYSDAIKGYRDNKLNEIEESHENWLLKQAEARISSRRTES